MVCRAATRGTCLCVLAKEALSDHHAVLGEHRLQGVDDPGLFLTLGPFAFQDRRPALPVLFKDGLEGGAQTVREGIFPLLSRLGSPPVSSSCLG